MALDPALTELTTASPVLSSFDWSDISNGTGYETYYLIESEDSTGKDYHLTTQTDYSNNVRLTVSASTQDHDYDLSPFVIPRTINGTVLMSFPVDGNGGARPVLTAELYKWDGSTETQLGSTVTFSPNLTVAKMLYMEMPIVNELIAAGQTLRLRVSWSIAAASSCSLGIDPANRAFSPLDITTTSKIHVPYKLDS